MGRFGAANQHPWRTGSCGCGFKFDDVMEVTLLDQTKENKDVSVATVHKDQGSALKTFLHGKDVFTLLLTSCGKRLI